MLAEVRTILSKISSYNILNYLIPGSVFCVLASKLTEGDFTGNDLLTSLILFYFAGLVVSRVGSLLIEDPLRKVKFLAFATYSDFQEAEKKDKKVEILSEANNVYRTFTSVFLMLFVTKVYFYIKEVCNIPDAIMELIVLASLFILFLLSYRKQTKYVFNRVKNITDKTNDIVKREL